MADQMVQNVKMPFGSVSEYYDMITDAMANSVGGNLHYGFWETSDPSPGIEAASETLTDRVIERLAAGNGSRLLDIGCGTGKPACRIAEKTGATITGITVSQHQVETANQRAADAGLGDRVKFVNADAMKMPFGDASFDA